MASQTMQLKLNNPNSELRVLRSLCRYKDVETDPEIQKYLLSKTTEHMFAFEEAKEVFNAIKEYFIERGFAPKYDYLTAHLISQDAVEILEGSGENTDYIIDDKNDAYDVLKNLENYRCNRILNEFTEIALEERQKIGNKSGVALVDAVLERLTTVRTEHGLRTDADLIIGESGEAAEVIEELLDKKFAGEADQRFFKTGFTYFDETNEGLPSNEVMLIGANSGGGKTAVVVQMAVNFAEHGYRVKIDSLEMSKELMLDRLMVCAVGKKVGINLTELIHGHKRMTEDQIKMLRREYRKWQREVGLKGGRIILYAPDHEVSSRDCLAEANRHRVDINITDYVTLLSDGMATAKTANSAEQAQWQNLGTVIWRYKMNAKSNNRLNIVLVQIGEDEQIRFSKTMKDHAAVFWTWVALQSQREAVTGNITVNVNQPKSRHASPDPLVLFMEPSTMNVRQIKAEVATGGEVSSGQKTFGVSDL